MENYTKIINPDETPLLKLKKALIFSDIDGTLIHNSQPISPKVKRAIFIFKKNNYFSLVTARSLDSTLQIIKSLNLHSYNITEMGARIIDPKNQTIWIKYLSRKSVLNIINILKKGKFIFTLCINGHTEKEINDQTLKCLDLNHVTRISVVNINQKQINFLQKLLCNLNGINFYLSKNIENYTNWNLDIVHKSVSKKNAVKKIEKILNINKKYIIGIGDGYGDIPFLSETKIKIVMENAEPKVKKIANYIVPPVWEDGVLTAFKIIKSLF